MNLSFDGLKKEFLKSGIVDLFGNVNSKNIVYWVINQLDQVNQSSENMIFSNNLITDFIIIKTVKPKGKSFNLSGFHVMSKYSLEIFKIVDKCNKNYFFNNEIKQGCIDMSLYFQNSTIENNYNCIINSLFFGLLFIKFNKNIKQTLYYINLNCSCLEDFENLCKKQYNLYDFNFNNKNTNINNYEYLSAKIKKNILIFVPNYNNTYKLVYGTKHKDFNSIKLLLDNNHCKFIFNNINIESKHKTFCDYCRKSFSKIQNHTCKRNKCENCFIYTSMLKDDQNEITCKTKTLQNLNYTCKTCNKTILNFDCMQRHLKLSEDDCTKTVFCNKCNKLYLKRFEHKCGYLFCKKCLNIHERQYFCSTSLKQSKVKIKETIFFLDIKYDKNGPKIITISEFDNNKDIIFFYFFYKDTSFYKKLTIDNKNLNVISSIRINCNIALDVKEIIQLLDIVNLKPKFLLEQKHLEYFINNINLSDCTFLSKNSIIYYIKSKYYSFISIAQYMSYDPIYILKHLNMNICPLYIIDINNVNVNDDVILSSLTIDDFTKQYIHSDYNMFDYINSFKNEIVYINKLNVIDFNEKSSFFRIIIYRKAISILNSLLKETNKEMNLYLPNNKFMFNCITDKQSSSSSMFELFINTINNQPLPTLNSNTPGTIYNTSKYEICFCETITEVHLKLFPKHDVKCYINQNGEQFKKNKFSLDW